MSERSDYGLFYGRNLTSFFKFQFGPGCFKGFAIEIIYVDPILDALVKCVALVSSVNLTFIIVFIQFGASFNEKKFL